MPPKQLAKPVFFDFDAGADDESWVEPIEFQIGGERFRALGEAPGEVLDAITSSIGNDGRGNVTYDKLSIINFLRGIILEEIRVVDPAVPADGDKPAQPEKVTWEPVDDLRRFNAMVSSKRRVVPLERLGVAMNGLMEHYGGRPS